MEEWRYISTIPDFDTFGRFNRRLRSLPGTHQVGVRVDPGATLAAVKRKILNPLESISGRHARRYTD